MLTLVVMVPLTCTLLPSDGDRLLPSLDALAVPASWEPIHTEVVDGGFIIKARATRNYFVTTGPTDSYRIARDIAESAGFIVRPRVLSLDGCRDSFPPAAMDGPCGPVIADDCPSYNGGLPDQCFVEALRWHDEGERVLRLWMVLDRHGVGLTIGDGGDRRYVHDPDRALVSITVDVARRDAYLPLPSWPPG